MATANGAMTLADYATESNNPLVREISYSLIKAGSVFTDIPLITDPTIYKNGARVMDNLPSPYWADLNELPQPVTGKATAFSEQGWIIRNNIDIDHYFKDDKNAVGDPFDVQIEMALRGLSYDLNDKVINNNHATGNPKAMVGIRARLDNPAIYGTNPACKIDAGGLNLSNGNITSATANTAIYLIQQALDEVGSPDGTDCSIYMNDDLLRRIEQGVRTMGAGGGFDLAKDNFDRRILVYKNATVNNIGRKAPLPGGTQSQYIISSQETSDGTADTGGTFTSFYVIKHGPMDFAGWQFAPLKVKPPYLLPDGVIYRVVLDWMVGLWMPNTRAIARVFDLRVA